MTASLPDRLRKLADEFESMRCFEDAALVREAADALGDTDPQGTIMQRGMTGYRLEWREPFTTDMYRLDFTAGTVEKIDDSQPPRYEADR